MKQFALFERGSGKWVDVDTLVTQSRAIFTSNRRRAIEQPREVLMQVIDNIAELKWLYYDRGTLKVFDAGRYMPEFD